MSHDDLNRLKRLYDRQDRGETLSAAEYVEYERLMWCFNHANDPINNPPPDAGLLLWSGE